MERLRTLFTAISFQITARFDPHVEFRLRQEYFGGGTKPHLVVTAQGRQLFSYNLFAGRLDQLEDARVKSREVFKEMFAGTTGIDGVAQDVASALDWKFELEPSNSYSLGLLGLGLLLQRFAFEEVQPVLENGYSDSRLASWLAVVQELEDSDLSSAGPEIASGYWKVDTRGGSAIFDLTEAFVYLLGSPNTLLALKTFDGGFYSAIGKIEDHLRQDRISPREE